MIPAIVFFNISRAVCQQLHQRMMSNFFYYILSAADILSQKLTYLLARMSRLTSFTIADCKWLLAVFLFSCYFLSYSQPTACCKRAFLFFAITYKLTFPSVFHSMYQGWIFWQSVWNSRHEARLTFLFVDWFQFNFFLLKARIKMFTPG